MESKQHCRSARYIHNKCNRKCYICSKVNFSFDFWFTGEKSTSPTLSVSSVDWYPDDSTTSPTACPGVGLLGVVSVVEEDLGRLICCCGSWVLRRCSAWGLPLRRGSRSPLPDPEPDVLLRRLWRLVPRFILPAVAEPCPAAEGTTGAERRSDSVQQGPKTSSEGQGEVPPADIIEEDEEEDEEGMLDRERENRLYCCWNSCLSPWPNPPMISLELGFTLLKEGCSESDEDLFRTGPRAPSSTILAPELVLGLTPSISF